MFTIKNLVKGQSITNEYLQQLIDNSAFQRLGNQVIGDYIFWSKSLQEVESTHHLDLAPNGTNIHANEHYAGFATLIKHSNKWYVTGLYLHN